MGFWVFMMFCSLLVPVLMIICGTVFVKHPPKTINAIYGYRTSRSMKNMDTWKFAHDYCGRLWQKIGWVMLLLSVLAMALVIGKGEDTVGICAGVVVTVQCGVLVGSIFPVERALRKQFDRNGRNRDSDFRVDKK